MKARVIQKGQDLICTIHGKLIITVIMDNQIPFQDIFLCQQCWNEKQQQSNKTYGLEQVKILINEKSQMLIQEEQKNQQQFFQDLEKLQQKIDKLRTDVFKYFDKTLKIIQTWFESHQQVNMKLPSCDLIKEIFQLYEQNWILNQKICNYEIEKINSDYKTKLQEAFQKLLVFDEYLSCYDLLNNLQRKPSQVKNSKQGIIFIDLKDDQFNTVKLEQVNSIKQQEVASAISFNFDGSIMASSCKGDINIWKFDKGQLSQIVRLQGHHSDVNCLVFSKKLNWFASGSSDKAIRCWTQQANDHFVGNQPCYQHKLSIYCIVMNRNEDQLISCSVDKTIKVWNVNCQTNLLQYNYSLERHSGAVYSISLNESETSLVSCSQDKQIILWSKGIDQRWIYQSKLSKPDYGKRICFINDYQIIWQQHQQGFTHVLEIDNGELRAKPELQIKLKAATDDDCLFPTIFHKERQIIIQKHNRYFYIIRKQRGGKFEIVADPIVCQADGNCGALIGNGDYFVISNVSQKEFMIFKFIYS